MGTGRKLLLADDSITIQKVVNLTFADEGMDVTTVGNGDLAIEKIEEISPDIVLADVHMPGLNGYEVCEFVKRNERFRHIPVMLLVGSFEPFNEAEARRVGADDYLTKPFQSIRQLVSKVGALLSGKSNAEKNAGRDVDAGADARSETGVQSGARESVASTEAREAEFASEDTLSNEARADAFGDPSLDDAMIETTPVRDLHATHGFGDAPVSTTPLSSSDLEQAGVNRSPAAAIHTQDTLRMQASDIRNNDAPSPVPFVAHSEPAVKASSTEDGLLDLGEAEPQVTSRGDDEFILDIWDDVPAAAASVATAESPIVQYQGDVMEVSAPAPPHVEATRYSEPESQPASVTPVVEGHAPQSYSGNITLEQLSPEVIDAIARRAVELLSEKVIEQIAWEVVPDLAERLIKRRLEETNK